MPDPRPDTPTSERPVLILDTAMAALTTGLCLKDAESRVHLLAGSRHVMARGHQERLGPEVMTLLEAQALKPTDLGGVIVTRGPGSFTGLRIGLSFARGLAMGAKIPLISLSGLTAMAAEPELSGLNVLIAYTGGRGQTYLKAFAFGSAVDEEVDGDAGVAEFETSDRTGMLAFISDTLAQGGDWALSGNATDTVFDLGTWAMVFPSEAPSLIALANAGLNAAGAPDCGALYLRAAEAKLSSKPRLKLKTPS